jgi:hypothetical protein
MTKHRQLPTCALVILALAALLIGFGQATTTQFTLKSGGELTHPVNLILEDRVLIQFKAVGGTANTVRFVLNFPNGTVKDFGKSGDFSYSFVCDSEGEYGLNFTNNEEGDILVTLNYEVDHYIFGMPQMLFMVIVIAVISMVGVAVFVGLSKKP